MSVTIPPEETETSAVPNQTNLTMASSMSSVSNNSTINSVITTEDEYGYYDYYPQYKITISYVLFVLFAIVILLGLIFNSLALATFLASKSLSKATTGLYLIALAVADNIFLCGDFLQWMNNEDVLNLLFYDESNFWCKIIFFLRYFGKLVSAWITVAITVERFISIAYPLKAGQLSTKRNTRIVISSIYICCLALTTFPFWTIGLQLYNNHFLCTFLNVEEYDAWNWVVNRVGSLLLPSVILFIFTGMIVGKLHSMKKKRKNLMNQATKTSLENQLTKMLIAVAVTFLLLRLPYTIAYYLYAFRESIWSNVTDDQKYTLYVISRFAAVLATANYASNFFLYCLAGSTFRSQFVAMICCRRREMRRGKTVTMPQTMSTSAQSLHRLSPGVSRDSIHHIHKHENNGLKY